MNGSRPRAVAALELARTGSRAPGPRGPVLQALGPLDVASFLRRHWQRRPVLVRGALRLDAPPLDRDTLFALAARTGVESRRVVRQGRGWRLEHGPFRRMPSPHRPGWTVLVQATDAHHPAAAALLRRFRFLPDARLDDLMMSYASDGGGVGPHVDSYDVFLIQAWGRRRWRVGAAGDPPDLVPGLPLRILSRFQPRHDWILEPGDLLYLPPGVPHDGIAVGECITCSVGFRAPEWRELLHPWLDELAATPRPAGRYADPGTVPTRHPGRVPDAMIEAFHQAMTRAQPSRRGAARALLAALSEPRGDLVFEAPGRPLALAAFVRAVARRGLATALKSRMLYAQGLLALNGELLEPAGSATARRWLARLADRRQAGPLAAEALDAATWRLLHDAYRAGWLVVPDPAHALEDPDA